MFKCSECDKTYTRKYDLDRHVSREHVSSEEMSSDACSEETSPAKKLRPRGLSLGHPPGQPHGQHREHHQCSECGALFGSNSFLCQHMRECGGGSESSDADIDDIWFDVLEEVTTAFNETFQAKVAEYTEDNEEKARSRAFEKLRPQYKERLGAFVAGIFKYADGMEKTKPYMNLKSNYHYFRKEKKYSKAKSLSHALHMIDNFFETLLDDYMNEQDSISDSSSDSSEDTVETSM